MTKYSSLSLLLLILLFSCAPQSPIAKQLAGCDSLMITFNKPGTDSVLNIVSTTDTRAIAKLAGYLGGKEQPKPDCGFGGNMLFFKGGQQVLPVVFQSTKDCSYFMYEMDSKLHYTEVGKEAKKFLESLKEGKNWY
ncbi:MAG: hypothetical protein J0M10_10735 [Chitinophagales bacterium]|nr:hypothetical protein [Chitinophagales bacterium]